MNPSEPTIASQPIRYFCHNCGTEVHVTGLYKCVVCSSGFVEEIPPTANSDLAAARQTTITARSNYNNDNENSDSFESLASTSSGVVETERAIPNAPQANSIGNAFMNGVFDVVDIFRGVRPNATTQSGASTSRQGMNAEQLRARVHNLLFALVEDRRRNMNRNNLTGTDPSQISHQATDLENMLMRTIRTLFSTTSRPLTNEVLDHIPKINIKEEDLVNHPKCSICWEEFKLNETVRKLPCSHLHHEHCIFPWLGKNRTCPLCRYRLKEELDLEDSNREESSATMETAGFESTSDISVETTRADIPEDVESSTEN